MRLASLVALAVSAAACAQPVDKPGRAPDARPNRADSVVERAAPVATPAGDSLAVTSRELRLGDSPVTLRTHQRGAGGAPVAFHALNLHDNESTSVDAALDVVRQRGGRVVELVHSGDRNATFQVGGQSFTADPNRMFTDAGRARTLASLSRDTPQARAALAAFADTVLAAYTAPGPAVVVTLHNNTPDGYSARSYQAGREYETDAAAVTVHPGSDPDDFFFVTDRGLYDALVARGFNAVLQDNAAATDDGSLSVWAAQNGAPYVNVEAQHGHRDQQARMIGALVDVLESVR